MSTVSRNCRECAQRLRGGCENTTAPPGSRWQTPWVLRPKRGLPQFTHKLQRATRCWRPGPGALACRPTWIGESLSCGRKSLRFPKLRSNPATAGGVIRHRAEHLSHTLLHAGVMPGGKRPSSLFHSGVR